MIAVREFNATFAAWLRRNRTFAGLSSRELADRIGVTDSAISAWERGITSPTLHNALLLCWALDVSLPDLEAQFRTEAPC